MKKTISTITVGTLLLLGAASTSHAADAATKQKQPLDQAIKSVDKNLAKNPENKGLQNAAGRLQTNQERHDKKRDARKEKRHEKRDKWTEKRSEHERAERSERAERHEQTGRPETMGRPNR